MTEPAAPTSNKQTIATISALVLGVAGSLGWIKPTDNTAAAQTYDVTRAAIEALDDKHDDDFDDLEDRHREFESWVARRLAEIDRDRLPEKGEPDEPEPEDYEPPPHKRRRPTHAKRPPLPQVDELLE